MKPRTPEMVARDAQIEEMLRAKLLSRSQIAQRMGVIKSVVSGVAWRMEHPYVPNGNRRGRAPKPAAAQQAAPAAPKLVGPVAWHLLKRGTETCAWDVCQEKVVWRRSYCPERCEVVYQKPKEQQA